MHAPPKRRRAPRSRPFKNPTPIRRFSISRVRGGASSIRAKRRRALSFLMITRTIRLPLKKHWMPRVRNFPIKRYLSRSIHTSTLARATAFESLAEVRDALLARSSKLEARSLLITMGAGYIYKVAEQITEE